MKEIGGYFGLELRRDNEYHKNALRLNTGRNAFELVLRTRKYSRVYVPRYACDSILEPFKKLSIEWASYAVDRKFEPVFDFGAMKAGEAFLYTNYFGIKDSFVRSLSGHCRNLIIDNTQAFYSLPIAGVDTFYSCRKFFGVPDGAYLYMEGADSRHLPVDVSADRFTHLIWRLEFGPERGFDEFQKNEKSLIGRPMMQMSNLTHSLLCGIDYESPKEKRRRNFNFLHTKLSKLNELDFSIDDASVPLVYPFLSDEPGLRERLIGEKVFVATYWPCVQSVANADSMEYRLSSQMIPLPVDQRYDLQDMEHVIRVLMQ
jgi:hypothetical protein